MKLFPFSHKDTCDVTALLRRCNNYAPETSHSDDVAEILTYFQDAFVLSSDGGSAYVVRDSNNQVCAFVTVDNRINRTGDESQYITGLYTTRAISVDSVAEQTMQLIHNGCCTNVKLYVNVHPANSFAVAYWETRGYSYVPIASDFTNCDNERLHAYEKNPI